MESKSFHSLVVRESDSGTWTRRVEERQIEDLPAGDVLVRVHYSSLNYKDALSASGNRGVTKKYPHTPGIDAAGVVVLSSCSAFKENDEVIVSGFDLGMNTSGGFGQYIRVPSEWVLAKPSGLSAEQCMQIGTAGFTAAQSVSALLESGVQSSSGQVLVTGATGGVGSFAVALLRHCGFSVAAATGKAEAHSYLEKLGATSFISREQATVGAERMLLRERWAGVVDTVGGQILATAIKSTKYGGAVTCCGNASSGELAINVYPFILRGVRLLGIDSAQCPMTRREGIWEKLATDWHLPFLDEISRTVPLHEINSYIDRMLQGSICGRIVVDLRGEE